jgi:hypothetical protein
MGCAGSKKPKAPVAFSLSGTRLAPVNALPKDSVSYSRPISSSIPDVSPRVISDQEARERTLVAEWEKSLQAPPPHEVSTSDVTSLPVSETESVAVQAPLPEVVPSEFTSLPVIEMESIG